MIVPGALLLTLLNGVKVKSLRNLTMILSFFAILHGFYHISYLLDQYAIGDYVDIATTIILVGLAFYYSKAVMGLPILLLMVPVSARDLVSLPLIISMILFARLAIKSKSVASLQAQLSIFLMIWIAAELLRSFQTLGIINASTSLQLLGLEIHTAAMIAFGGFIFFRFYHVVSRANYLSAEKIGSS